MPIWFALLYLIEKKRFRICIEFCTLSMKNWAFTYRHVKLKQYRIVSQNILASVRNNYFQRKYFCMDANSRRCWIFCLLSEKIIFIFIVNFVNCYIQLINNFPLYQHGKSMNLMHDKEVLNPFSVSCRDFVLLWK